MGRKISILITGRAGYITRLEAFVDLMRRKTRKAKMVQAKWMKN